jgi:Tfp pilus assembly protein PilZ
MEKRKIQEKREHVRADVASLVVIKCDIRVNISNNEKREFHTYTKNMSEDGINVTLEKDLHRPDTVELKLYLTGRLTPIECKGQVAWSKVISPQLVEPRIFSIGIKFIELDDVGRETIRKLVSCL